MSRTISALSSVFFLATALAAGGFALSSAPTAVLASEGGSSYCENNYPGNDYCNEDMKRNSCQWWGCNTEITICCIPPVD